MRTVPSTIPAGVMSPRRRTIEKLNEIQSLSFVFVVSELYNDG